MVVPTVILIVLTLLFIPWPHAQTPTCLADVPFPLSDCPDTTCRIGEVTYAAPCDEVQRGPRNYGEQLVIAFGFVAAAGVFAFTVSSIRAHARAHGHDPELLTGSWLLFGWIGYLVAQRAEDRRLRQERALAEIPPSATTDAIDTAIRRLSERDRRSDPPNA